MACRGLDMLGSTPAHRLYSVSVGADPSKVDVQKFQGAIMSLPKELQQPEFVAMVKAVNTQVNAFGVFGPATKKAAAKFNKLYSWDQGEVIDSGTLEALTRPDLKPDYAAKMAQYEDQAKALAEKTKTVATADAIKPEAKALVAQVKAQAVTPEQKQEITEAEEEIAKASSPDEARAAVEKLQKTVGDTKKKPSWFLQETVIPKVPNYGVVVGTVSLLGLAWYLLRRSRMLGG